MATFFNPYLARNAKKEASCRQFTGHMRIVPKCFKKPHDLGIVSVKSEVPCTFFKDGAEGRVYPTETTSMWNADREPAPLAMRETELTFHVFNVVETTYSKDRCEEVPFSLQTDIIPCGTVIKLLGRTSDGRSVCVNVFGQQVYFYTIAPPGVSIEYVVQQALHGQSAPEAFGWRKSAPCGFSITQERKHILRTYDPTTHDVYKISLSAHSFVSTVSNKLRDAGCEVFETNVDATRRFVIDRGFSTFGWYTCTAAIPRDNSARDSWTDLEFDCNVRDLHTHPDKKEWPEYTVLSFDIECIGEKGFPTALRDEDMIIQISCILWKTGSSAPYRQILLNLGTCVALAGVEVYEFPSEFDMLHAFFALLRDANVDIITGYNIANFDLPYILDRATQVYSIRPAQFCRVKSGAMFEVHKPKGGNVGFLRAQTKVKMAGTLAIDMYIVCKEKLSLSDYKLNTVAAQCLNGQQKKDDVSYKEIPVLFRSGPEGRGRIGVYCVQDSVLVMELLRYFMIHVEVSEIAKIAMIPVGWVLANGQQVRVFSCLLAAAKEENYILPEPGVADAGGYQGATVISPISGFYNNPVLVVDFASLYPSIIQAHNLCYSTLIPDGEMHRHPTLLKGDFETFHISSGPVHFVKKHVTYSLLSKLLATWLAKRKAIRRELSQCSDPQLKTILDKQQLAIKVTCNAVYGFTGVASGLLPCLKIAETVTLQGRRMLERSKRFIEAINHRRLEELIGHAVAGADGNAEFRVVYGDTDSLFIECRGYSLDSVSEFCDALASVTSGTLFTDPIKLEAEKTFKCLLLLTKKRYIGILSTDKILMKGVDLVRKTACLFVQERCRKILSLVLQDEEVKEAAHLLSARKADVAYQRGLPKGFLKIIDILNQSFADLSEGRIPISHLQFSTELSRDIGCYKTVNLPHLVVYQKILERNEEVPQVHDRIPYVFIKWPGAKKSDMAEDPKYVQKHNIPIAANVYFDKLVHGVANILQCLFDNDSDKTVEILYNFVSMPFYPWD
ncbi:DNA polymerase catalytic subunit [Common bottlenose dolphin gammaherpesvirus 1 strain Sarasota]|uniref:DNA polymerase n=7 Tax=Orthoherpesviridae TaxID=3044472 RepID=A0A1Z1NE06_9GAMA|nr:DNA polymerase catalytic subunit [Common bottlenose dolphin gammaherpesvirus 1 strain Sarasota]ARW78076.1 DNA polymerase catalytic subunit [Common bottlenose dolphin gammaherpesvirus 1 strain Sarasota]